jgi:predicted 2-oxoglutarate/Fe(II)-dependent dioxygenase YbiX
MSVSDERPFCKQVKVKIPAASIDLAFWNSGEPRVANYTIPIKHVASFVWLKGKIRNDHLGIRSCHFELHMLVITLNRRLPTRPCAAFGIAA